MRLSYYQFPDNTPEEILIENGCDPDDPVVPCSVKWAKKLLKQYGGFAWTDHIERDGSVFEVTEIKLKGNNSKFTYNHHL